MFRWIAIGVLSVAVIGTAVWGYNEYSEKNEIKVQAENEYQRSFHELTYYMDLLNDEIGTALAMNSKERLSPQFVDIWRLTSQAHSNVGQLPLGLLPFHKTEQFLSDIGEFTYQTAVRNLDDDPLTEEETQKLKDYYAQSGQIKDELRQVQHVALDEGLSWMDVQLALSDENSQQDNTIVNGFQTVEKSVEGFGEGSPENSTISTKTQDHSYKNLTGSEVTENEALQRAMEIFEIKDKDLLTISESGEGADTPLYSISYTKDEEHGYMDMAIKGGHPLSLLVSREMGEKQVSLNEGSDKANEYLKSFGLEDMTLFQSSEYDHIGVYSFLYNDNGVRVYSDAVEVKVGLDNGDLLGLTTDSYFMNHTDRDIPDPKISEDEAIDNVNSSVDIQESHLAVIDNDAGDEILTYEFLGVMDDETYRIFINAENGQEELVEKLDGKEVNYNSVL
ncbi:germination protein YpeB [Oceanobacillus sp. 1P07AA]|uniref:germination protein YpeB n=1 Tax=Oceanobacillus sp. 1P07AA TaxID=3132293 RepID=UPI0039A72CE4